LFGNIYSFMQSAKEYNRRARGVLMTSRIIKLLCFIVAVFCVTMAAQTEPTLVTVNMPKYPPLARQARIEGVVRLTFILSANAGDPPNIEVVSGHPMLKGAAIDNVRTWKFENPYKVERKYETTFRYRLSDHPTSAPVTFESFHEVDLVADVPHTTINY
jgi:TonB family protein